jgi:molybdopterin-guanine dinucleotide biosynthesis protein B
MIPIVSIVGKSNSGKTTLIEKMIAELSRRGWRVASIKHNRHGFEIDHEGKDSWRQKKAGAVSTVIASPQQIALIEDTDRDLEIGELAERYIRNADIILVEGYKSNPYPKIEVFRAELKRDLLSSEQEGLMAVASDVPLDVKVPVMNINDVRAVVDLVETRFLKQVMNKK